MDFSINYFELAKAVTQTTSARYFFGGGLGALTLGIILQLTMSLYKTSTNQEQRINWEQILIEGAFFAVLIFNYSFVYELVLGTFQALGTFGSASHAANEIFERRMQVLKSIFDRETGGAWTSMLTGFGLALQRFVVQLSLYLTLAVIFTLKHLQAFMLALLLNIGPILLGFAMLGRFFRNFALSWFWTLVEVAFWGVAMNVLMQSFAMVAPPNIADDGTVDSSLMAELTLNFIYAITIGSVPIISAMFVRGQSGAMLSQKAMSGAQNIAALKALMATSGLNLVGKAVGDAMSGLKGRRAGSDKPTPASSLTSSAIDAAKPSPNMKTSRAESARRNAIIRDKRQQGQSK